MIILPILALLAVAGGGVAYAARRRPDPTAGYCYLSVTAPGGVPWFTEPRQLDRDDAVEWQLDVQEDHWNCAVQQHWL